MTTAYADVFNHAYFESYPDTLTGKPTTDTTASAEATTQFNTAKGE